MKILTVIGARPQFIKASIISDSIRRHNTKGKRQIEDVVVHTGQHFDYNMSQVFFDELGVTAPKYSLDIHSATHGVMTGKMMMALDKVMIAEKPDLVLVFGDTNSTLAGAICASKLHLPLAHIEAGLRAFNKKIPEEVNRILTDQISDFLFCPSQQAVDWLKNEGIVNNVFVSGDVMYDSVIKFSSREPSPTVKNIIHKMKKPYAVVTIHRADNTTDSKRLKQILKTLQQLIAEIDILFLVHPRTSKKIIEEQISCEGINIYEPLGYYDLLQLVKGSQCVFTDSGGLQKEAFFLEKPCITLRDETEWVELVKQGANILAGADEDKILSAYQALKNKIITNNNIYGDGRAGDKIISILHQLVPSQLNSII